jgi:hypothetical protein
MAARVCIFCGGSPLTREHAWPQWLRGVLPDIARERQIPHDLGRGRTFKAPGFSLTIKAVCGDCNHGWMSKLEAEAMPHLSPMIAVEGGPVVLGPDAQTVIARWTLKTALILREIAHDNPPPIPRDYYAQVRADNLITPLPSLTYVRLAQYGVIDPIERVIRTDQPAYFKGNPLEVGPSPSKGKHISTGLPNAYGATIAIGYLVLQVLGIYEHRSVTNLKVRSYPDISVPIWPFVGPQRWPPRYSLNEEGLKAFSDAFRT